jgi:hypothetical protein
MEPSPLHWEHRLWATGPPGNSLEILIKFDKSYSGFPGGASVKELTCWDFPGGPGAKTPCSQCRGPGFDFWSGNQIPHASTKGSHASTKLQPNKLKKENSLANAGDIKDTGFDPWVMKIPWRRSWQPTPVFLPGESHRQRSLASYSPWGLQESDMTQWLTHMKGSSVLCTVGRVEFILWSSLLSLLLHRISLVF